MNSLSANCLFAFATLLSCAQAVPILENTWGHDIIDGVCTNVSTTDRVYYDHVDKMAFPLIIRSETVTYYGDANISCIQALNQKNNQTGGGAVILEGGVGHTYVVIDLESNRSHGLEYYVSIYARNVTTSYFQVVDTIKN